MTQPKPIDELSADDLRKSPIWEYATDCEEDYDETYVRPLQASVIPRDTDYNVFHIACELTLATGKQMTAFMSICNGELHASAPIAVGSVGDYWPLDEQPSRRDRARHEAFFGASYSSLLPAQWRLLALVDGESNYWSGVYAGG